MSLRGCDSDVGEISIRIKALIVLHVHVHVQEEISEEFGM
jgi:hypothetical protein